MAVKFDNADGFRHAFRRDTFAPGGVHMVEFLAGNKARCIIVGPYDLAIAELRRYFVQWPAEGYGTRQVDFGMNAGHAKYVLERRNSCD